jgi:hypothetical protein
MSAPWECYEKVTRQILDNLRLELGFASVEGKGDKPATSETDWEADATCYRLDDGEMVLIECKHWSSRVDQATMGSFAFSIIDTGAAGGLMVTPVGYQEGAVKVANARKIGMATLNANATDRAYVLRIANQLFAGVVSEIHVDSVVTAVVVRNSGGCGAIPEPEPA